MAQKKGPGRASKPGTKNRVAEPVRDDGKNTGRYVAPDQSGRITVRPPEAKHQHRESPKWMGRAIIGTMVAGVTMISLNYLKVLPGSTSPWYLVGGLALIFGGFIGATRYE